MTETATDRMRKVKSILVTQEAPTDVNSPYLKLAEKYNHDWVLVHTCIYVIGAGRKLHGYGSNTMSKGNFSRLSKMLALGWSMGIRHALIRINRHLGLID